MYGYHGPPESIPAGSLVNVPREDKPGHWEWALVAHNSPGSFVLFRLPPHKPEIIVRTGFHYAEYVPAEMRDTRHDTAYHFKPRAQD